MIKRRAVLLDVEAIAIHFGVARGTVRRWASLDGWHPYGTRRFRHWNLWDAQVSYDRRHPRHAEVDAACA